jgi:hypothetical protein
MTVEDIKEDQYIQGGLVASTKKEFWQIWARENKNAMKYRCQENDILNLIWYKDPVVSKMKRVIFDKEKNYYGCKSLNREPEFYLEGKNVMCRGEKVFAYHWAKGGKLPKLQFDLLPFPQDVREYLKFLGTYGQTVTIL